MLTPMDIHNHQFKKSMVRGYNENEVDDFLDRIVVDYEKILRENERLRNIIDTNDKELEHYRKLEKTMNDTLLVAQKTADDVISSAKKSADELKENAALECQTIRAQAQLEAQQYIENALKKRDAILAEYSKIASEKNSFLLKIRTALESELAITTQSINNIPHIEIPIEKPEPVEKPKPVETPAPPEKVAPVETPPEVVEKVPEPIEEENTRIVNISSKPDSAEKKNVIPEETKIYTFVKKSSAPDEEAAN